MKDIFRLAYENHKQALDSGFTSEQIHVLEEISRKCLQALKNGHKLLLCGNGGSASDSQHIAAEFVGRFHRDRKALAAIALTTDTSILTAVANDYSYDEIFSRQIEALANSGDVLFAISTSGNSHNVLKAIDAAKKKNVFTVGMTGKDGGKIKDVADLNYTVPSNFTPHIQEIHIMAMHAISEAVEQVLFA